MLHLKLSSYFLTIIFFPSFAFATNINLLDPGDVIYQTGWTGILNAKEVIVVRVDPDSNKAKIRDVETGITEWVHANDLYTKDELSTARWAAAGKAVIGAAEGIENGKIQNLTNACVKDKDINLVLSLGATFKGNDERFLPEKACKCLATNIYRNESQDVVTQLSNNFENVNMLGEKKFEEYFSPCLPPAEKQLINNEPKKTDEFYYISCLINLTGVEITYQYRWDDEADWKDITLKSGWEDWRGNKKNQNIYIKFDNSLEAGYQGKEYYLERNYASNGCTGGRRYQFYIDAGMVDVRSETN